MGLTRLVLGLVLLLAVMFLYERFTRYKTVKDYLVGYTEALDALTAMIGEALLPAMQQAALAVADFNQAFADFDFTIDKVELS